MELNPRWLMVFRAVAKAGSISAGSRTIGLTQPTATAHIDALERAFGEPLLLRDHTGVRLTSAGSAVLPHAESIADHLDAVTAQARMARAKHGGVVRVAAFQAAISTFIPPSWARLREAAGDSIHLVLSPANPPEALERIDAGEADIAVVYQHRGAENAVDLSKYTVVPLAEYEVRVAMNINHPLASTTNLTLADFADDDWAFCFTLCKDHLIDLCHNAGFEPRVCSVGDDWAVTQELVAQGVAIGVLTECCLDLRRNPAIVSRALPELESHLVFAVCLRGAERVPANRAVIRALRS